MINKKILHESFVLTGNLPKSSNVNINILHELLLEDFKYHKDINDPDIKLTYNKHQTWVMELLLEFMQLKNPEFFRQTILNIYGNVEKKGQFSVRRNHYNNIQPHNGSAVTCLFFLKGSGKLIIEYNNYPILDNTWTEEIKPKKFVMFNSNLNYYRTINEEDAERTCLVFTTGVA